MNASFATGGLGMGVVFSLKDDFSSAASQIGREMNKLNGITETAANNINKSLNSVKFGFGLMTAGATLLAPLALAISSFAKMDDAISDVKKATGMAGAELENFKKQIFDLDTRTNLLGRMDIAKVGGQLGVANSQMADFVKMTDMAVVALGDEFTGGVEGVTKSLGVIKNLFKETKELNYGEAINRIGSAINSLGAAGQATGGNIADFANRIGGATGFSIEQTLALGAALEEFGVKSEIGASGTKTLLKAMTEHGNLFATLLKNEKGQQMSMVEYKNMYNTDLLGLVSKVGALFTGKAAYQSAELAKSLKITDQEAQRVLMALANDTTGILKKSFGIAEGQFKNATSLLSEFQEKNENLPATIEKLKNAFAKVGLAIGNTLSPVVMLLSKGLTNVINGISYLMSTQLGQWITGIASSLGGLLITMGLIIVASNIYTVALAKLTLLYGTNTTSIVANTTSIGENTVANTVYNATILKTNVVNETSIVLQKSLSSSINKTAIASLRAAESQHILSISMAENAQLALVSNTSQKMLSGTLNQSTQLALRSTAVSTLNNNEIVKIIQNTSKVNTVKKAYKDITDAQIVSDLKANAVQTNSNQSLRSLIMNMFNAHKTQLLFAGTLILFGAVLYGIYKAIDNYNVALAGLAVGIAFYFSPVYGIIATVAAGFMVLNKAMNEFSNKSAADLGKKGGFIGFLEKVGGLIEGVRAVFSSFNSELLTFQLSKALQEKLEKIGMLDTVKNVATWLARFSVAWDGFKEGLKNTWQGIKNILTNVINLFSPITNQFQKWGILINQNTDSLMKWKKYGEYAGYFFVGILGIITIKLAIMAATSIAAFLPIYLIITGIGLAIYGLVKVINWAYTSNSELAKSLKFIFNTVWELIKTIGTAIWGILKSVITFIANIIDAFKKLFEGDFKGFIQGIGYAIWDLLVGIATAIWGMIKDIAIGIWEWVKSIPSMLYNAGAKMIDSLKNGILSQWEKFKSWLKDKFSFVTDIFSGTSLKNETNVNNTIFQNTDTQFNKSTNGEVSPLVSENKSFSPYATILSNAKQSNTPNNQPIVVNSVSEKLHTVNLVVDGNILTSYIANSMNNTLIRRTE